MVRYLGWLLLCASGMLGATEIYQCQQGGTVIYSDTPCGDDAVQVPIKPPNSHEPHEPEVLPAPEKRQRDPVEKSTSEETDCPYINTTKLRRHIIKKELLKGMKPKDVERAWGKPSNIVESTQRTKWTYYHNQNASEIVYFENGCVSDWETFQRIVPDPWERPRLRRYYYRH